jgi:biotin carboxylase
MSPSNPPEATMVEPSTDFNCRKGEVVVLVDPYSTGCLVGQEIEKRGYILVCVWTHEFSDSMKKHVPISCRGSLNYHAVVEQQDRKSEDTVKVTAKAIEEAAKPYPVVAIIAGGDRGVDFADALSEYCGLLSNGTDIPNRRDKKIQQELVGAAGLRSVRQAGGAKFSDLEPFLLSETFPVVLKPIDSAGSDGVKLCHTFEEAKDHFHTVMGRDASDGGANCGVLAQEFLRGKEYVVDHSSRDGVHKTMMVWVYDKRPANGASFVYYGCIPVDSESPEAKILIPYVRGVLDAIGVKHGASHGEVMMTPDGPCLVEMNCRTNGGDGIWRPLVRALTGGYTQVEATADAFLDKERFLQYPDKPPSPFKAAGQEIELVSYSRGTIKSTPGYEMISQLPSFVHLESLFKKGSVVDYTVDLDSCIGTVCLVHPDKNVVEKDVSFIRYMEEINGIFLYEKPLENLTRPRGDAILFKSVSAKALPSESPKHNRVFSSDAASLIRHFSQDRPQLKVVARHRKEMSTMDASKEAVVIVDPYSTGTCIAQEISKRGYKVIALWTKGFPEAMKTRVPISCGLLEYYAEISEGDTLSDTVKVVEEAAKEFQVIACIAGDEAGIDLADALSEKLHVRTNGSTIPKRDKRFQQELIRKAGLRSVRQASGSVFSDVEKFLKTETFPVVVKPIKSAGSDAVKLCHNVEDAKDHFELLVNSRLVRPTEGPVVLVQEFLRGKEYVIDHVSRDGVHKLMMIWYYDKRPANATDYVHFGCVPVDSDSPEAVILIPYVRAALNAMGVKNGPSHAEVVMAPDGPCLVKMNCSAHGGDGNWAPLCRAMTGGYSQVEATVDAYLDKMHFSKIPDEPPSPFKAFGLELLLVSFSRGEVKSTPGFDAIRQLPSFVYLETGVKEGSVVDYTVDLFTSVGSVILMHFDGETLEQDVARIREMEQNNTLFVYDIGAGMMKSPRKGRAQPSLTISADRPELS